MFFNRTNTKPRVVYSSIRWLQRAAVFLCISLIIQGCATKPQQMIDIANLDEVSNWNARGKLLIKNNKEKLSGYFFWQQQKSGDFKLVITSFIGTSLMTMEYKQGLAEVKIDSKTHKGHNPEFLIYQLTGSYIPVSNLSDWMLAKAPVTAIKTVEQNQLKKFNYKDTHLNDWQVSYQSYQTVALLELPKQMTINGLGNRIKLTVNDWEILAP